MGMASDSLYLVTNMQHFKLSELWIPDKDMMLLHDMNERRKQLVLLLKVEKQ